MRYSLYQAPRNKKMITSRCPGRLVDMANEEKHLVPIHPGEILNTEFLRPLKISQNRLAREIGVPPRRINEIVHKKRAVTADTALRLSKFFGTTAQFWLNLQSRYELDCIIHAERTEKTGRFDFIKAFSPESTKTPSASHGL
jgi:addiction module HigA family antidote